MKVSDVNISRLPYHLIDIKYIKKDITEKNKKLRTTENPEEKEKLKSEIEACYLEIKKVVLRVEQEQKKILTEEQDDKQVGEEQNLSERQLNYQTRKLKDSIRIAKAFQNLVNTPTVLKNIRSRA